MDTKDNAKKIILTTEEFYTLKSKLEDLKTQIYKTDFNLKDYIDDKFTQQEKELILEDIDLKQNTSDLEKSLEAFLKIFSNTETISIKIAFDPTVKFVNWMKEFLTEKISLKSNLIMKIEIDKSLLAGAYIEFRGKIISNSIKNEVLNILSVK